MRCLLAVSCACIGAVLGGGCDSPNRSTRDPDEMADAATHDAEGNAAPGDAALSGPADAAWALDARPPELPPTRVPVDWVRIEGGRFMMGPDFNNVEDGFDEDPFPVHVPTFDLMRTEVTVAQYKRCVLDGGCQPRADGANPVYPDCSDEYLTVDDALPVNCVSWEDAQAYARWVGGESRLPTQSEWEFAARGRGQGWTFPWGDDPPTCDNAVIAMELSRELPLEIGCGRDSPWPPCSRPLGNSPEGVCDLVGNVEEWTEDNSQRHTTACIPDDGSPCRLPAATSHVVRGCAYFHISGFCEPQRRWWSGEGVGHLGFRLARPVAPESWRRPVE